MSIENITVNVYITGSLLFRIRKVKRIVTLIVSKILFYLIDGHRTVWDTFNYQQFHVVLVYKTEKLNSIRG